MTQKENGSDILFGMKSLCQYLDGISEATVLKLFRQYSLPIKKMGGIWQGSKKAIDKWSEAQVEV